MRRCWLGLGGGRSDGLGRPLDGPLRTALHRFDLHTDQAALLRHYTLFADIEDIRARGFADLI